MYRYILASVFVFTFLCFNSVTVFSNPKKDIKIEIHNGKVTASIEKAVLNAVLESMFEKTGIEYVAVKDELNKDISVHFKSLPMATAFERILEGLSYMFAFGDNDNITKVYILGFDKTKGSQLQNKNRGVVSTTKNSKQIVPASKDDYMFIEPGGDDVMEILPPIEGEEMVIEPPKEGEVMVILPSSEDEEMIIEPPSEDDKMVIDFP